MGNSAHEADAHVLEDSLRWLVCGMVALCYVARSAASLPWLSRVYTRGRKRAKLSP